MSARPILTVPLVASLLFILACEDNTTPTSPSQEVAPVFSTTLASEGFVPVCRDLIAAKTNSIGNVCVIHDRDALKVRLKTTEGWTLTQTHVAVAATLDDIPTTLRQGNPQVGQFAHHASHEPTTDRFTTAIDLADLGIEVGIDIVVAVHSDVIAPDGTLEGAWAEGTGFSESTWAMHFPYGLSADVDAVAFAEPGEGGIIEHEAGAAVEIPENAFEHLMVVEITQTGDLFPEGESASGAFSVTFHHLNEDLGLESSSANTVGESSAALSRASQTEGQYSVTLDLDFTVPEPVNAQSTTAFVTAEHEGVLTFPVRTVVAKVQDALRSTLYLTAFAPFGFTASFTFQALPTEKEDCFDEYSLVPVSTDSSEASSVPATDPRRPVVFVHGWQAQRFNCLLWKFAPGEPPGGDALFGHLDFTDLGTELQYWRFIYPSFISLDRAGDELAAMITQTFGDRGDVVLVGHSMGGLVARSAVFSHGAASQVERVITLGTPHEGSPLADWSWLEENRAPVESYLTTSPWLDSGDQAKRVEMGFWHNLLHTEGMQDLTPDGAFIQNLQQVSDTEALQTRFFTLAGRLGSVEEAVDCDHKTVLDFFVVRLFTIPTLCTVVLDGFLAFENAGLDSDGIVPLTSALVEGTNRQVELGGGYDHWDIRKGKLLLGDPVLSRVAELIGELVDDEVAFTPVDLATAGGTSSLATSVNELGHVVGRVEDTDGISRAAIWVDGNLSVLGTGSTSSNIHSTAWDVNNTGWIVGDWFPQGELGTEATVWEDGKVIARLGTFGGRSSWAYGVNDEGQVVGSANREDGVGRAFFWEQGVMTDLGTLGGEESVAYDINDAGVVVGEAKRADGSWGAFLWRDGAMMDLGTLGGQRSMAMSINDAGQVVGWAEDAHGHERAFVWEEGLGMRDLGIDVADRSGGEGINNAGQIVGWLHPSDGGAGRGFFWDTGVLTVLEPLPGYFMSEAWSINDDRDIAGPSRPPTGPGRATVWRRDP